MVKIFGFEKSQSGCDWYRIKQPLLHIRANKAAEVRLFHKGKDFDWFSSQEAANELENDFSWADVLFVPRLSEPGLMAVLKQFQDMGKKIVTEWDDNFMEVNPLTQQYGYFGQEEYSEILNGEKLEVWKDGKNIDLALNRETMKNLKKGLSMADMVITTGPDIADAFRPLNKNIRICPNSVDINFWNKLPLMPRNDIRMGWFGGDTHYHDWVMISGVLREFMKRNPGVTLVLMGGKYDGTLKGIDQRRIEYHTFVDINAYPYKAAMLDLDFALIPLVDTKFNRCKSSIKWLEMGALNVPSVTSYVPPYSELMDKVENNGIFIQDNDLHAWMQGMETLTYNSQLRKQMGEAARKTVEQFYDANKTWKYWVEAFEEVASWPSQQAQQQLAS